MIDASLLDKLTAFSALIIAFSLLLYFIRLRSLELLFWSTGMLLFSGGFWLHAVNAETASPLALIFGKTMISMGVSALILAVMKLDDLKVSIVTLGAPVLLMLVNQIMGMDDHIQRAAGCSFILGVQFLALAFFVLLARGNPLNQERVILLTISLIPGVIFMFRALIYLMTPATEYFVISNSPLQLMSIYSILLFLPVASLFMVLLRKRRLIHCN